MSEARLRVTDEVGETWDDPTEEQLQRLYAGLNLRCRFLVLERLDTPDGDDSYLQIFLNDDLTMAVEYRDGGPDSHHRADVPLSAERGGDEIVIPVLVGWAFRREGWRGALPWVRWDVERERPWEEHRD
ncbi:hypothetical protein [Streptomyces sp. 142MFCol3.1]|uniref:hypothetical protein n=1 Tax=Streptomyces sp. 142MFCol3.1 TaxID=1172179 RepID=UPI000408F004|nr:hypothetical protein [Streptomyces sp. 142MFCol3.1]